MNSNRRLDNNWALRQQILHNMVNGILRKQAAHVANQHLTSPKIGVDSGVESGVQSTEKCTRNETHNQNFLVEFLMIFFKSRNNYGIVDRMR